MKLYLVQHGEALEKEVDPDRPLSNVGHAEVGQLAASLKGHMTISRSVHSGKTRARQTAEIFTSIIADDLPVEAISGIKPNDSVSTFANQLMEWNENLLVVGHLPFLSKLVSLLVAGDSGHEIVSYTPGTIVCLELVDDSHWQVQWMVRPELVNEK